MAQMSAQGSVTPEVRLKALQICEHLDQQDFVGELCAIGGFVRDKIRYMRDVYGVETLQTPQATLEFGQGDCDDKATLLASLLLAAGIGPVFFVVLCRDGRFIHVWTEPRFSDIPIPIETTLPLPIGRRPPLKKGDRLISWPVKAFGH